MIIKQDGNKIRLRKHLRIRSKLAGTAKRPRLSVFISNSHVLAQIIDDDKKITLASASTIQLKLKGSNITNAVIVGTKIAEIALKASIQEVVFDRSGYLYHGKVKALADAAREAGLKF
jgi:large subunit ribosomal protein L18